MAGADGSKAARKQAYFGKLVKLLDEYPKIFICLADNVGSNHMQKIRKSLRGEAVVLMGKNTMIRKAIRGHAQNNAALEGILPHVKGNVGFVFTKGDLTTIKKLIVAQKVAAVAKAGSLAPVDVFVPAGPTGLEPTQTSFLQALNIPSKIVKGQIEISQDVHLLQKGQKVGASEANLLGKLNIKPFEYGLVIKTVYDNGLIIDVKVLDITDEDILTRFRKGVKNVASVSLATGIPTVASLPHQLARAYKNVLAVSLGTEYTIKQTQQIKNFIANPNAFAAAKAAGPPAGAAPAGKKDEAKKKEPEPAAEEEEEEFGAGGLFGDD
jgi:large subunit ribosomal protein LP0